ncbi:hypothetical protein Scep_007144 [Stephania cephalantha]|uniref:DUF547 domain-containing protein n=1 Tax=Stephania cephalantha TaxID=152367 RepID=A0AAP0PLH8_9MAGN
MAKELDIQDLQCIKRSNPTKSPFHQDLCVAKIKTSSKDRVSLERDIDLLQLRLQQEKSMRILLERTMGRASSTLSPGHRHFAAQYSSQTKELIAEIELLEEEVATREKHVLSLYRSIFEQSVSRAPSEQNSCVASPAHSKTEGRKHPSIISSAFCSSKNFPLQPFQVLTSRKDFKKKSVTLQPKTKHSSMSAQTNTHDSDLIKAHHKVQTMGRTALARTLKDHLYQCPSKLSEELVRCMAAVYCWLQGTRQEKNDAPLLSRSSTNMILPRHGIKDRNRWSYSSPVEISQISTDKNQFSRASCAINNYRALVEQLERVNMKQMGTNAQTAFWINVYNSLVMHAYLAYGVPRGSLRRMALFYKAAYNIGGYVISANAIEHSIFSIRTPRVGRWFESIIWTALRKKSGEEKQLLSSKLALKLLQPFSVFALCTGATSDPMLRVYTATNVNEELEVAKREFLQANVMVKKSHDVLLPKILERFAKEANICSDDLLKWVMDNVEKELCDSIQICIKLKAKKKTSHIIDWLPYDAKFRYIFCKDLTEKPWWA